jgi:hypothetical protein
VLDLAPGEKSANIERALNELKKHCRACVIERSNFVVGEEKLLDAGQIDREVPRHCSPPVFPKDVANPSAPVLPVGVSNRRTAKRNF